MTVSNYFLDSQVSNYIWLQIIKRNVNLQYVDTLKNKVNKKLHNMVKFK